MPQNLLTWIHLSDLHMENSDTFNRSVVLEALWRDIKELINGGLKPDFIAFTGDVAFHGTNDEYKKARELFFEPLLAHSLVPKERLFTVPGNHDVNRKRTARLANPLLATQSEDDIRRLFESPDESELLASPLASYAAFVESFCSAGPNKSQALFSPSSRIQLGDRTVGMVFLNSAWLSGFNRNVNGEVDDCGHLALGELQVQNAFSSVGSGVDFHIVLVHHPFDWLLEFDRFSAEELIARHRSIILRGHLHRPDAQITAALAGEVITIPAGAVYDSRKSPNAYNFVQLDLSRGAGTIHFRRYNDRRREWQKDIESTGEALDGRTQFKLPGSWRVALFPAMHEGEMSRKVTDYTHVFTDPCRKDMKSLKMEESGVLDLVQNEFRSHVNYFLFDLEDYPLPVKGNYIIYLDKVGQRIEFRKIIPCTADQAKLAAWNDILTLYRRATRMAYREDPSAILLIKGTAKRAIDLNFELLKRLMKYYEDYELVVALAIVGGRKPKTDARKKFEVDPEQVAFRIRSAGQSCSEASTALRSLESGDITPQRGVGLVVISLEQSLQHIHQLILMYPPAAKRSNPKRKMR
jgi:predicted MPP superfamily phosphohydrolase